MPIPIKFGTKELSKFEGEGDNKKEIKETVDNIINNTNPAWTKKPNLKEKIIRSFTKNCIQCNLTSRYLIFI